MIENKVKIGFWVLLVALIFGLADSIYLSYSYLNASPLNCFLFDGCGAVAASPYSKPFGVPLAFLGLAFYSSMIFLSFLFLKTKKDLIFKIIFLGALTAFVLSLYFTYLQGFVIQAFCIYCIMSAIFSTVAFCTSIYLRGLLKGASTPQKQGESISKLS